MIRLFIISVFCLLFHSSDAGDPYPRNFDIDIQHYGFRLEINDSTNVLAGNAEITILFRKSLSSFELDLAGISSDKSGMKVISVAYNDSALPFSHQNDRLQILLDAEANLKATIKIQYAGIPSDGLIISTNKFGDRTFFGDNWPNRAHHWLPTIDHPYDKASCEFIVIAPNHYQTIANGVLIEKTTLSKNRTLVHWKETAAIPTKVMVIGVARFATIIAGRVSGIPVATWVYPQNHDEGFHDFQIATQILEYFTKQLGTFPFQKLANVQSTTRYGGMENASNIFYYENAVTGKNEHESLIAHEIAHQWFGDSASEQDWHHVWLSEGFATYLTSLYLEEMYGVKRLHNEMQKQRDEVTGYFRKNPLPVVDTTLAEINLVLNTNSYQKGAWFLHMLRKEVGDEAFWRGINEYYNTYQFNNAMTEDFKNVMERVSGRDLQTFFHQWLFIAGHPRISGNWAYDPKKKVVKVLLRQNQPNPFRFPIDIGLIASSGSQQISSVILTGNVAEFTISSEIKPKQLLLDPNTWLLFEGEIQPK